jgi:hypothetical protein
MASPRAKIIGRLQLSQMQEKVPQGIGDFETSRMKA